ncbi:hypothetical protein K435DRAFT_792872 [Dendrothele bispora CBS 962.96]|uniref:Uncharacterized protein n=1 Tax=Dendrothele bispora (strain CBS 962.96) TaxID=1314807 RepID=A0A4V4HHB1_DENBC|nr:hypothetical protein K435DRAFT_792872 [Dendrothele bispora CBS 962.96]
MNRLISGNRVTGVRNVPFVRLLWMRNKVHGTIPVDHQDLVLFSFALLVGDAIYGIIAANQNERFTFDMNWSYTLDDSEPTSYTPPPRTGALLDSFYYNVSLLSLSNLHNAAHTLVLEASLPAVSPEALRGGAILFDYAKYQFDDGSDSSSVLTTDGSSTTISGSTVATSGTGQTQLATTVPSSNPSGTTTDGSSTTISGSTVATSGTGQTQLATTVPSSNPSGTGTSQADANAKKKHLAVILGLTFGGLAFLSFILTFFFCIRRHPPQKKIPSGTFPFKAPSGCCYSASPRTIDSVFKSN